MSNTVDEKPLRRLESGTFDVPDVASLLKCSERTVRRMAEAGEIPGIIRFGRLVRFHRGIVNDWLIEQAKGANHE